MGPVDLTGGDVLLVLNLEENTISVFDARKEQHTQDVKDFVEDFQTKLPQHLQQKWKFLWKGCPSVSTEHTKVVVCVMADQLSLSLPAEADQTELCFFRTKIAMSVLSYATTQNFGLVPRELPGLDLLPQLREVSIIYAIHSAQHNSQ